MRLKVKSERLGESATDGHRSTQIAVRLKGRSEKLENLDAKKTHVPDGTGFKICVCGSGFYDPDNIFVCCCQCRLKQLAGGSSEPLSDEQIWGEPLRLEVGSEKLEGAIDA